MRTSELQTFVIQVSLNPPACQSCIRVSKHRSICLVTVKARRRRVFAAFQHFWAYLFSQIIDVTLFIMCEVQVDIASDTFSPFSLSLFLFFSLSPPSVCRYLPLLRVASSVQQLSAPPGLVRFLSINSNPYIYMIFVRLLYYASFQNIFNFIVFLFFFGFARVCCCVLVPGTLAFHLRLTLGFCDTFLLLVFF